MSKYRVEVRAYIMRTSHFSGDNLYFKGSEEDAIDYAKTCLRTNVDSLNKKYSDSSVTFTNWYGKIEIILCEEKSGGLDRIVWRGSEGVREPKNWY
jgi:hypothetical protein